MKQLLKYILQNILENLKLSEAKHSISIALSSGISVFLANFVNNGSVLGVVAIIFCLLSVIISFFALSSKNIKNFRPKKNRKNYNLTYFKDISFMDEYLYLRHIINSYDFPSSYKPDNFEYDLARQIVATSIRAHSKYSLFNYSLVFLCTGIVVGILNLVIL